MPGRGTPAIIRCFGRIAHTAWISETYLRPPLRLGILLNSLRPPAWVHRVLGEIQAASYADLVLVVLNKSSQAPIQQQIWQYRRHLLPLLYERADALFTRPLRKPDAHAREDIRRLLGNCPVLEVTPRRTQFSDYFSDKDLAQIETFNLDVALRFGFRILRGRALSMARYGVWSYHHGDNLVNRGGPNSFWEVVRAEPATGAVLQVLTEQLDAGRVLARTWSATHPYSLSLNRNAHYWKAAELAPRKLRELYEQGPQALDGDSLAREYRPYDRPLHRRPTNLASVPLLARFGARAVGDQVARLVREQRWLLAYEFSKDSQEIASRFYTFKPLLPPAGRSWSDPFPVLDGERYSVIFAEKDSRRGAATILGLELSAGGPRGAPVPILSEDAGLAYPCVTSTSEGHYLTLTRPAQRWVELYRCRSFPFEWEIACVLLQGVKAANVTLERIEDRWWLFVSQAVAGASQPDELHLYHATSPLGPWRPHQRNPVVADVRAAQPGGRIFTWRGGTYRPAQDWSLGGPSISIRQLLELTPERYREREVAKIRPLWRPGLVATKTLNHAGRLTVIDAADRPIRRQPHNLLARGRPVV